MRKIHIVWFMGITICPMKTINTMFGQTKNLFTLKVRNMNHELSSIPVVFNCCYRSNKFM